MFLKQTEAKKSKANVESSTKKWKTFARKKYWNDEKYIKAKNFSCFLYYLRNSEENNLKRAFRWKVV